MFLLSYRISAYKEFFSSRDNNKGLLHLVQTWRGLLAVSAIPGLASLSDSQLFFNFWAWRILGEKDIIPHWWHASIPAAMCTQFLWSSRFGNALIPFGFCSLSTHPQCQGQRSSCGQSSDGRWPTVHFQLWRNHGEAVVLKPPRWIYRHACLAKADSVHCLRHTGRPVTLLKLTLHVPLLN